MECCEIREELSCYMDGELEDVTAKHVEAHLAECADCRAEMSAMRTLVSATHDACEHEPPVALKQAIMGAVEQARDQAEHDEEMGELLSAFVDGELCPADLKRVTTHLAVCTSCRERLSDLRSLALATQRVDLIAPPAELRSHIAAATSQHRTQRASLGQLLRHIAAPSVAKWAAGSAAAGLIALGVILGTPHAPTHVEREARAVREPAPLVSKSEPAPPAEETPRLAITPEEPSAKPVVGQKRSVVRRYVAPKPKAEVVAVVQHTKRAVPKTLPKPDAATTKPTVAEVRPATSETTQPVVKPVETVAVIEPEEKTTSASAEAAVRIKKPEPVDVAEITAQDQENIRKWLQEAKAKAATKKSGSNGMGITLLNKEF